MYSQPQLKKNWGGGEVEEGRSPTTRITAGRIKE